MKIVHLSTNDYGGAAVAALRLHDGLLKSGVDSSFISRNCRFPSLYPNKFQDRHRLQKTIFQRVKSKAGITVDQEKKNLSLIGALKGQYEIFSFPFTDFRPENNPLVHAADVIHLHWVSNYINYTTFFQKLKNKKIVWTFHDMNPFMGGFHYAGDVNRNKAVFQSLEEGLAMEKAQEISAVTDLSIITPSLWLAEFVKKNPQMSKRPRFHIPYGLDLQLFKPVDKKFARAVFNLSERKKILLFVSENVNNYRKGFDLLTEAINGIVLPDDLQLVVIGDEANALRVEGVRYIGKVTDDRLMALLYGAADAFILPSREDNFPNVMLEAIACGTPVISFSNGGMAEVIVNGANGILIPETSADALRGALTDFVNERYPFDVWEIRKYAEKHFALETQADSCVKVYRNILGLNL
jgi:glycosyltransferase involved in cell wall biosynthesis